MINISAAKLSIMKALLIQNHPAEDFGAFETYLRTHNMDYSICHAYQNTLFPTSADYDAVIVGGTPISIYDQAKPRWLKAEIAYLSEVVSMNKPYLGICGGGQLLASILGAEVKQNPAKEVGIYKISLTNTGQASLFFKGFPKEFSVFQFHGDTFDVPIGAELLAEGIDCKNQAFSRGKALAVQFHLEICSATAGKWTDEYAAWLGSFHKSKTQIERECESEEIHMRTLSDLLIKNFLQVARM